MPVPPVLELVIAPADVVVRPELALVLVLPATLEAPDEVLEPTDEVLEPADEVLAVPVLPVTLADPVEEAVDEDEAAELPVAVLLVAVLLTIVLVDVAEAEEADDVAKADDEVIGIITVDVSADDWPTSVTVALAEPSPAGGDVGSVAFSGLQ